MFGYFGSICTPRVSTLGTRNHWNCRGSEGEDIYDVYSHWVIFLLQLASVLGMLAQILPPDVSYRSSCMITWLYVSMSIYACWLLFSAYFHIHMLMWHIYLFYVWCFMYMWYGYYFRYVCFWIHAIMLTCHIIKLTLANDESWFGSFAKCRLGKSIRGGRT